MENKKIRVLVARTLEAVDAGQCDDVRECDTMKEAKAFAKHALTDEYQRSGEFTTPMAYSRVMRGDQCEADYFRKPAKVPTATKRVRELLVDLCQAQDEYNAIVGRLSRRGCNALSDQQAGEAGIDKRRQQEKILVIAWHMTLAAKGRTPENF